MSHIIKLDFFFNFSVKLKNLKKKSNLTDLNNFHSLEIVNRESRAQLQVGENFK